MFPAYLQISPCLQIYRSVSPDLQIYIVTFLLREGESRKFLGLWITSGTIHEAKKRQSTQVITCSFLCGKWLHMIGARASPGCELCKRERQQRKEVIDNIAAAGWLDVSSAVCNQKQGGCIGIIERCIHKT
jgi:hypothetical protein